MREFATIFTTQVISADEAPGVRGTDESWDDEDVIDSVLRLVADHHRAVGAAIGQRSFSPSLAELRQSPLGQDLRLLAVAGYGDVSRDHVQETVGRVTDLLLRPLAAENDRTLNFRLTALLKSLGTPIGGPLLPNVSTFCAFGAYVAIRQASLGDAEGPQRRVPLRC